MSRSVRPNHRSRVLLVGAASLAITTLVIAGVFAISATTRPHPTIPAVAEHFMDVSPGSSNAALRTVVIAGPGERLPFMSETDSMLMASLEQGTLPAGAARATVLTDANCQPDQDGVSHCLNELDFGTARVVVRHHHKMSEVPCLTPGEEVNILSLAQYEKVRGE
jgi:hypothetical protein